MTFSSRAHGPFRTFAAGLDGAPPESYLFVQLLWDATRRLQVLVVALRYGGSDGAIGRQVSCIFILLYDVYVIWPTWKGKVRVSSSCKRARATGVCVGRRRTNAIDWGTMCEIPASQAAFFLDL